jgi:hypothetical protein
MNKKKREKQGKSKENKKREKQGKSKENKNIDQTY